MTWNFLRNPAAFVIGTLLLAVCAPAQTRNSAPASPYGGTPVAEIIARVNDQIISTADYGRAMKELDQEERQRGASMQQISEAHKDLLRGLIDQQLWLSKGKGLGINGETELINRLNEIRKQYNLATLEDLEKAAEQQGVSFEDFKANIRNQIVTQQVMRQEVGAHITMTPSEVQRYFEAHKAEYSQPESVQLSEILVSTGTPVPSATQSGATEPVDEQKVAAAKAKADDIVARLHAGGDFTQLAKSFSDGPTGNDGGNLGTYKRGELAKVFEDAVFPLKNGENTDPIRTKQGFIIFKVIKHVPGGIPAFKDVEQDVEQTYYMGKMEPAIRAYLTKMREEAYIDIKPGFVDTGASPHETKPVYSAYVPPSPKKRKKVERTRFRETGRGFRQKSAPTVEETAVPATTPAEKTAKKSSEKSEQAAMKPGKKEKIRFGHAPQQTLPNAAAAETENAGALPQTASSDEPLNPLEAAAPEKKTRFSQRARLPKQKKSKTPQPDAMAPDPADAAEISDRQTQSSPLGLSGDTASKKKKKSTTTGEKTRITDRKKDEKPAEPAGAPPLGNAVQPAPTPAPVPQPAEGSSPQQ